MWRYASGQQYKIILYFICHIISLLGMLGQPYAFSRIIDAFQLNDSYLIKSILFWIAVYICLFFVFNVFHRLGRFIEQKLAFRIRQNFINSMCTPMRDHLILATKYRRKVFN
jgi:ABC-type multidrug transport system fused ATPase/permease subunit